MPSCLVQFFQTQINQFDESEKRGQSKSGNSIYKQTHTRKKKRSIRLTVKDGNAQEVCLPPREKFRTEIYLRIIDSLVQLLKQRIETMLLLLIYLAFFTILDICFSQEVGHSASKLISAYPDDFQSESLCGELIQFASFLNKAQKAYDPL